MGIAASANGPVFLLEALLDGLPRLPGRQAMTFLWFQVPSFQVISVRESLTNVLGKSDNPLNVAAESFAIAVRSL